MKTEQRLAYNIQHGDRAAMRQLYNLYSGYAMALALRYVPDRDDASDILQDSFVKVFSSISTYEYRGEGSLKSWVARIVVNEALGFLRRRSGITFTDEIPESTTEEEPDIGLVSDEKLSEFIALLPEGYRVVLNLYVFGGMSHKEIAEELGITPSTSASQFFHAKKMLARMINEYTKKKAI